MNKRQSTGLSCKQVKVTDIFLENLMETVRKEVIPYQWAALNDEVEGAVPSFCMRNFKVAAKLGEKRRREGQEQLPVFPTTHFELVPEKGAKLEDRFYGFVFQDTDFSKWIEAVGYSLAQHPDLKLEKLADEAIEIVCAAQYEDGYLDTFYIINDPSKRFTNLKDHHELYCFGHLTEGAIAYYEATGKDKLLRAAMRFADYIVSVFGEGEGKRRGYPGHEIAEMALVRLYEVTGKVSYLQLAKFFIDERGKKPHFFDMEQGKDGRTEKTDYEYYQAHLPVREQKEAVGHAVRAVYLYTGMAEVAKYTEDEGLKQACRALWESIENTKLCITGGIGASPEGEAFSYPYHLPNDNMYNETCASIGLAFFARRMLEMEAKSCYADVMERAVYNGIISGMAIDGKSFFYVNPLEVFPEGCKKDSFRRHVAIPRQKWFGCACCPPNLSRFISSIASYAYSENESTLFMHLYCGGDIIKSFGGKEVKFCVKSEYPWEDTIQTTLQMEQPTEFTLAIRMPGWCPNPSVEVNGTCQKIESVDGYIYLQRLWKNGDTIMLQFPMQPIFYRANTKVREDVGKVALVRGPVVYCVEEADNGTRLDLLEISMKNEVTVQREQGELGDMVTLSAKGRKIQSTSSVNLYEPWREYEYEEIEVKFIPYYAWCNRGVGEMRTFLRWY